MQDILKRFNLDAIYGLDAETFWSSDYTLSSKKMSTTDYIVDPRFKLHMMACQRHNEKRATVRSHEEFKAWARTVNWKRTGVLCHHAQFDGLILSHHYKIKPAFFFDTMSMGRALMPVQVGHSLHNMCVALGLQGKKGGNILVETKGKRVLTPAEYRKMKTYAGTDIEQTWLLLKKLLPFFPESELRVIDLTIRMYTDPTVLIDEAEMMAVSDGEKERKASLLKNLGAVKDDMSKNGPFIERLKALGVEIPMKLSPTKKKRLQEGYIPQQEDFVPALSKQDLEFKRLLQHPDQRVRDLVETRFAVKSTNMEKKAEKLANRARLGAVPIYLNCYGAHTLRWSGSDGVNWQNMNRKSDMRKAIKAPPGYVFIIADQSQIEARMNAWYAEQMDVVEAFRNKLDVYRATAAKIYGKRIEDITDDERFVGKTAVLGLGYQAGAPRFADMLRIGQFGPPVDITDNLARDIVRGWRATNNRIVAQWKETQSLVRSAFVGKQTLEHRHGVVYEGRDGVGFIHHIPTGMSMRYDGIEMSEDGDLTYVSAYRARRNDSPFIERTKLYGGLEVENRTQFIARMSVAANAVTISQKLKKARIANTTHDELLIVVPIKSADRALRDVIEIMETPPAWAEGMPFGVDAKISHQYDK